MRTSDRFRKIIPSKRICEEFYLAYELKGAQRAVNLLTKYYKIRKMKIIVNGHKVGNNNKASYNYTNYTAFFKKNGINRFNVLHELYHHIANVENWEFSDKREEREADKYAKKILNG